MKPILEIKGLTKEFPARNRKTFTAVDHVSFDLYPGETLGIVGGSGSGKSTVARMITHLLAPTSGTIRLCGEDITKVTEKERRSAYRHIQMVFQTPSGSFDPRKTLGYGIGESLRNIGLPRAEIREKVSSLLAECGLSEEFAGRYPYEVSGGQCQRAAIARALAIDPEILICDEATSALDVTVQEQIIALLRTLKMKKRLSCIFICHNLALVQAFCDRVLVMHNGKVIEEGTPDEVIRTPKEEYTKQLIDAVFL